MHFRAIGKIKCPNCREVRVIDTAAADPGFIDAKTEAEAAERFKLIHRVCATCLKAGTPVAVEFDGFIRVEALPGQVA
jgi:ribosomal protein L32